MNGEEFRRWSRFAAEWGADYRENLRARPVRAQVAPGQSVAGLAPSPPETGEAMEAILADFERKIMPGVTHWQHPRFFAYFPANAAPVSVVAEYFVTAIAAQCMLWQTSPAATELEVLSVDWLRQALGLPQGFAGVIQDSASSATHAAVLTMRETALGWSGNENGLSGGPRLRVYCSSEVHSSVDRAVRAAGIGEANLVKLPASGQRRSMDIEALERAIRADLEAGMKPAGIVASVGGTSAGGTDDVAAVADIARKYGLYLHVDAAWAGSAMICPEFRTLWEGASLADSIVVNPHKWLGAQFDCTVQFLADPGPQVRTLAIRPAYLETHGRDGIINFSEWTLPLGRRFRALKLWFLLRAHGLEELRAMIRNHVSWSRGLCERLRALPGFEIASEPVLSLFTFRLAGGDGPTRALLEAINDDGRIYLTQTVLDGKYVIRFQAGQFDTTEADVELAFDTIREIAARTAG